MTEEKIGIENIKKAVLVACGIGSEFADALEDDKITIWELGGMFKELRALPEVIRNRGKIKEEFLDLDASEVQEIEDLVAEKLEVDGKVKEFVIWSLDFIELILNLMEIAKKK